MSARRANGAPMIARSVKCTDEWRAGEHIVAVIMGTGPYTYQLEEGWGKLPDGWSFLDVAAVAVDRQRPGLCVQSRRTPDDRVRS